MDDPGLSAERLGELLCELAPEAVSLLDADGIVTSTNDTGRLVGTRPGEHRPPGTFAEVHPEDLPRALERWSEVIASPRNPVRSCLRMRHPDGSWRWIEAAARNLLHEPLLKRVVIHWRDLTAARDAEQAPPGSQARSRLLTEQYLQAHKMEAIGRLAGGVAHDFNNLLSIIVSAGALLQQELPADHPSQPLTEEIRTACRRAAELTRQLLAFSGRQRLVPSPLSVNEVVRAVIEEVEGRLGAGITIATRLDPEVGLIEADGDQLEKVIVGLAHNACEAMPNGGVLSFSTANVRIDASELGAVAQGAGEYVRLEVRDSGVGMSDHTRAQLFEPFFTTKPRGKGLGLGLAIAYGVIRQSKGHLRVQSQLGEGTSFFVLFPRLGATALPAPARSTAAAAEGSGGTEVILLVEDDDAVRRVTAALLAAKGYRVIQVEGGPAALAVSDAQLESVGLLLTDVMMPGLSGPEVAAALRARRPALKVLFMSAYHDEALNTVLQKPFTLETLNARVRELLDQPTS